MSLWDDYRDEYQTNEVFSTPCKSDKYWQDANGKKHHIKHMDLAHCQSVVNMLGNHGLNIPTALLERINNGAKNDFEEIT